MKPIYIAKEEADRNSLEFKSAVKQADARGVNVVHVTPDMITLTRTQARNRAAYQKAQEAAEGIGRQVIIVPDNAPEPLTGPLASKTFLKTESTIYVTSELMRSRADFLRLEAEAKRNHQQLRPIKSWDALPDAERKELEALVSEA
ncbi:hypothetical protein LHP98_05170 [Rhodobacter sp. Har01]|uniref:hypothetical protein n=1 Tax=Rhodobacter sp. Har01 TaxID=2883999 RepID=UPI001D061DBE|nr:hypothetical protein [Rhodobacter sp. Har01]MCB6177520.1 hypothetical protein [Rhodobacter sp. Har01]